jgi:hypothetical protein
MITVDDAIVLAMVLLAAGYMTRRLWRRLRPGPLANANAGCGSCGGCDGAPAAKAGGCAEAPLVRRD